jgi:beta-lactamase superfamily II metal-dependent hydrolase
MRNAPNFDDYVSKPSAVVQGAGNRKFYVLWGDGVRVLERDVPGGRVKVKTRGKTGWIAANALGGKSLLEFYFIDVGQGDGVLIKTPDFRHILIDAGYPRKSQPTGKSGADFVDWKFAKDYGTSVIELDAMIASHIDADHYGGLADLLDVSQTAELDCTAVRIEAFYHGGLSHWKAHGASADGLGPFTAADAQGRKWFTRLLTDRASAVAATDGGAAPQLKGWWRDFVASLLQTKRADGQPTDIVRLGHATGWLPGFPAADELAVRVLGPVEGQVGGAPALLRLGSDPGQNTNGTSILLRFDYKKSRTLVTGDLNRAAHRALLAQFAGQESEFACDVGKACHHGAEDVAFSFLEHMHAACTVISSGDEEGHDHPRPRIVAASGLAGFKQIVDDEVILPLVYSTELARSIAFGKTVAIDATENGGVRTTGADLAKIKGEYRWTPAGALNPSSGSKSFDSARIMHRLIYGLVNVRTDGSKILTATMNESDSSFSVKQFTSRF